MRYSFAMLAAAVAVNASPFPQAVTAHISPSAPAPSGCTPNYSGTFGIAVMNVTAVAAMQKYIAAASSSGAAPVTTLADGQPGASTGVAPVKTISDGQPQASTGVAPVKTISDGQPQATTGVAPVKTISDGQPQAPTMTVAPVKTISDGQPQAMTMTMMPMNQITDGQIQQMATVPAVATISDGQPQATTGVAPVKTISDGQPQAPTATASAVKTISDGQPQASTGTASAVKTISDGQPQASTGSASAVKTISDGQPQASTGSAVATMSDNQPYQSASATQSGAASGVSMVACKQSNSLQVTMANGILTDNKGRTGYIAANYQFQFDGPPQAGAIYTAGFSVCGNGSLALGGSAIFYQCLSGNFYNLYDRNWAPQCNPVDIMVVALQNC